MAKTFLLPLFFMECHAVTLYEGYVYLLLQITSTILPRPTTVPTLHVGLAKLAANEAVHLIGSIILPLASGHSEMVGSLIM